MSGELFFFFFSQGCELGRYVQWAKKATDCLGPISEFINLPCLVEEGTEPKVGEAVNGSPGGGLVSALRGSWHSFG